MRNVFLFYKLNSSSEYERGQNELSAEEKRIKEKNSRERTRLEIELDCAEKSKVSDAEIAKKEAAIDVHKSERDNAQRVFDVAKAKLVKTEQTLSELKTREMEFKESLDVQGNTFDEERKQMDNKKQALFDLERRATRLASEKNLRAHERYKILRDAKLQRLALPVLAGSLTQLEVIDNDLRKQFFRLRFNSQIAHFVFAVETQSQSTSRTQSQSQSAATSTDSALETSRSITLNFNALSDASKRELRDNAYAAACLTRLEQQCTSAENEYNKAVLPNADWESRYAARW